MDDCPKQLIQKTVKPCYHEKFLPVIFHAIFVFSNVHSFFGKVNPVCLIVRTNILCKISCKNFPQYDTFDRKNFHRINMIGIPTNVLMCENGKSFIRKWK